MGELLHQGDVVGVSLLHAMHPSPLTLKDDSEHIPEEVVVNCDIHCQNRLHNDESEIDQVVEPNETSLFDILTNLNEQQFVA